MQRYYPPGATTATFAVLPARVAGATRTGEGVIPDFTKESAIATFASLTPDSKGVCSTTGTFAPTDVDAGAPETHIKYEWSNFRLLNNATYVSTVFTADLAVTVDSCTATYQVDALGPVIACVTDDDCCHLDSTGSCGPPEGASIGSGLQAGYAPKCRQFSDILSYESQFFGTAVSKWKPDTAYAKGKMVYNDSPEHVYVATVKGTSWAADAGATGPKGSGTGIADGDPSDGGVAWDYVNDGTKAIDYTGICVTSKTFDELLK